MRIWGPMIVVAGGFAAALPAMGEEDLFQAPTVSPPTASSQPAQDYSQGYGGYGIPPVAPLGPTGYGPPPYQANYMPPPYRHPLPPGPFGEPLPDPRGGHSCLYRYHGDCDSRGCNSGNCDNGGCDGNGCGPGRTCWINDQYEPEWYVSAMIGFQNPKDMQVDYEGLNLRVHPDGGWMGSAAAGWAGGLNDLGRHRFEVEFNVRSSDIDRATFVTQPLYFEGDISTISVMANLYWDFKRPGHNWYPYIGGGVGGSHVNMEQQIPSLFGPSDLEDNVYSWQLMAGLTVRPKPYLEYFVEARYFATDTIEVSAEIPQTLTFPGPVVIPGGERNFRAGFHTFGVMFGARILLGKRACETPSYDGRASTGGGWHWQPFRN